MTRITIIVAGAPRAGKTTLADALGASTGVPVRHTDELVGKLDWSGASAEVSTWFDARGPWIVEGVTAVRAIRKWLAAHAWGKPADVIYFGTEPRVPRTKGQEAMAKSCATIWREVLPELVARNATVLDLPRDLPR